MGECFHAGGSSAKNALLPSIVLAELLLVCAMILAGQMIVRHDALQYLTAQYYFLNNSIVSGEVPLWLPFMMQGSSTATWVFGTQGSLLQHALLLAGDLLPRIPFLPLFYGGLFADTLLFLTGVWLLARRFFRSAQTAFVVTVSAAGSLVWVEQPWFNFHFVFAVPLILHCLHSLLETGRWRYLTLAASLFALQLVCNLPYFAPVISLVIFLYCIFYAAVNLRDIRQQWSLLRWGPAFWTALASALVLLATVPALLKIGTEEIVLYGFGRSADGTTPLPHFLTYGGSWGGLKWIELALGVSPGRDYTLYMGILGASFLLVGLLNLRRRCLHFLLLALVMLGFSMGTWIATFFYYTWPFMKFYRHLALTTCFIKLCLCFLAGLGFETLFLQGRILRIRILLAALWGLLGILLFGLASNPSWNERIFSPPFFSEVVLEGEPLYGGLARTGCVALAASLFCMAPGLRPDLTSRWRRGVAVYFLALHLLDLYSYKFLDAFSKTSPLKVASGELVRFQPLPYPHRRAPLTEGGNSRFGHLRALPIRGQISHFMQSFMFQDEPGSSYRSDYSQKLLNQLMKAFWGQPLQDDRNPPAGYVRGRGVIFPFKPPAALKIAGVQEDKIQFFSEAHLVRSEEILAGILRDPSFGGDLLFLLIPQGSGSLPRTTAWAAQRSLSSNQRLRVPYRIERFDSNHLELVLETPPPEPGWLYYSDVWHPFWKATVDGEPVPVLRANLAYKAVPIGPGARRVHFHFRSPTLSLLQRLVGLNAFFWLVLLLFWTGKAIRGTSLGAPILKAHPNLETGARGWISRK